MFADSIKEKNLSSADKLELFAKQGFIFHGSYNNNIEKLEPRNATDSRSDAPGFNIDTAVFASFDIASTVAFALFKNWDVREDIPEELRMNGWEIKWTDKGPIASITEIWKPILNDLKGYVYILPAENFTERDGSQFKSKVSVTPIATVPVSIQDYFDLGGKLEFI